MAEIKRVSPEEAKAMLENDGYRYVDVRSEPEFEGGHVPGAYNVPLLHRGRGGMTPNPDFLSVMEATFAKDQKILVGCRSGGRSMKAATTLAGAGFVDVVDLRTGWEGCRDAFGQPEPGWSRKDLPVEIGSPEGRSYGALSRTKG